ncbi:MAG: hypothetical protein IPP29_16900 [Bacteroidetes bacterium]|nr:hypothetical protein [Bacteroidota bacterium]
MLLDINNFKYITTNEIAEVAKDVYGDEWMKEISNWKNPKYQEYTNPEQAMSH